MSPPLRVRSNQVDRRRTHVSLPVVGAFYPQLARRDNRGGVQAVMGTSRRVFGIGVAWAVLWLAFWGIVVGVIAVLDPDSIDPGEPLMFVAIFGPMGLLTGIAFGILLTIREHGRTARDLPLMRAAGWGILSTAIVQVAYLGHGDAGLAANIKMALLFAAFGGVVTTAWLVMARRWSRG